MTDIHELSSESDARLIEKICAALRQTGGLLPVTDREVELTEESRAFGEGSSPDLADPYQLFREGLNACTTAKNKKHSALERQQSSPSKVEQSLAMAAREGKNVPREVRLKMLEDRKRAESDNDNEKCTGEEQ